MAVKVGRKQIRPDLAAPMLSPFMPRIERSLGSAAAPKAANFARGTMMEHQNSG
ncbi:hypothetical protein ACWTU6_31460 [Mesorhizobium sp. BHbsci]